ncbi:LUD domain-containing protein [Candidatus Villigracilis saccharophilus]|uniref:LUD domain-containing protein n=1 Tax=Candidatus Villigracilis saccharophilus TaxID=3140684 RepID=UPI003136C151|nr:LUD domain-containing protein [Anaerolineales bacterium]
MFTANKDIAITPIEEYAKQATDEKIERTSKALEANGIQTLIAETGAEAKRLFLGLIPEGSEVFLSSSVTLEQLGIVADVDQSGRFDAVRPKMYAMNRETQGREIRKLIAAPDFAAGSVHAVTEDGHVLIASATGSQLGPYASGAGRVIWVVGAQKIVKDLNDGFRRIQEHVVPLEEEHMQQLYKVGTAVNEMLIVNRATRPGRITMILVKEELGF